MVSGCAIMVLVEAQTGFAAASYATDTALLAELRAAWPPATGPDDDRSDDREGYRPTDVASLEIVGTVRLTDRFAVALATDPGAGDGAFVVTPLARDDAGGRWRLAIAGDGLSAFVAGVPMASERSIAVDQTNSSVVVGERAIVKWFRRVGPAPSRAATLLAHLGAVGFDGIPAPLGSLTWRSPHGVELTLAQGDAFLPGARDGWDWCGEAIEATLDPSLGTRLGELTAKLHEALATSSAVIPEPVATAGTASVAGWRDTAAAALDDALALTGGEIGVELHGFSVAMRRAIDSLPLHDEVLLQPTHGDFHVGQVLEWSGGLVVIDFDGNPTLGSDANAVRQPAERDIAQMHASIDLVGRVSQKHVAPDRDRAAAIDGWIEEARRRYLVAVGPFDERLLVPFEVEQLCRELVYAARFLPRWRYAPMAALRARYGR
jgi:maltokinase